MKFWAQIGDEFYREFQFLQGVLGAETRGETLERLIDVASPILRKEKVVTKSIKKRGR